MKHLDVILSSALYSPILKKLRGHVASELSVCSCVRPFVCIRSSHIPCPVSRAC